MPPEPTYEPVPIRDAAGGVGAWQIAIGVAVVLYALLLALRPPGARRGTCFAIGLCAAFVPVVLGHVAMLFLQMRVLGETARLGPGPQREMIQGMESASVHTWIGWTASAAAFVAMLLARLRFPKAPPGPRA